VGNVMDRLERIGNGQVPAVVKLAWNTLTERAASMPQEAGPKDNIETCNTSCNT
jgi:hypothetical protein